MKVLNMSDVELVEVSPGNNNLFFSVKDFRSIEEFFLPIMKGLKDKRLTLIF